MNGKPTSVVLAYLSKADNLQKPLEAAKGRVHSWSHGALAALYGPTLELQIAARREILSFRGEL